ncbi:MAG: sigma-70 family RNA polymerase sigma factor [Planctomycetota bacterium]
MPTEIENQDSNEFMLLLLEHRHRIIAFIAKQLVNSNDVEDVFQKTSLVLWEKRDRYDARSSFFTWACGVAYNEIRNYVRTRQRDRLHFDAQLLDLLAKESEQEDEVTQIRLNALRECLKRLSDVQRQLVRQCYVDVASITSVAQEQGINRGALYKQLARIKQKLLSCIRLRIQTDGADV